MTKSLGRLVVLALLPLLGCVSSRSAAERRVDLSDLNAWRKPTGEWMTAKAVSVDPANAERFTSTAGQGILVNGPKAKTVDLISQEEFGDAQVHVEFCIPKHSNSGVYLMGRYEIQVDNAFGAKPKLVEKDGKKIVTATKVEFK